MIILTPGLMVVHQFAHRPGLEEAEHERTLIEERFLKFSIQRRAEPVVHDVYGEPAFLPFQDPGRQILGADLSMQPFPAAITDLETGAKFLDVLHNRPVEVRHTGLQAMGHRQFICIHEQLVRKRRSNLQQLESSKLIGVGHLRDQVAPVISQIMAAAVWKEIILE